MVSIRPDRRLALGLLAAAFAVPGPVHAASFAEWVAAFRARALAKGVSAATYDRVMGATTPDTAVYALSHLSYIH